MVTKFRTWLTEASVKVGDVYRHKRVIDPATNKPGMRYKITKVQGGVVYYRPVDGGGAQKCDIEEVDKWLIKEARERRKQRPWYEVVHRDGAVVRTGISRTEAEELARAMGKNVRVRLVKREVKEGVVLDKKVLTPEAIASKHNVPLERVRRALEAGTKVEHEHTSDEETARRIALAHLGERPDYYTRLKKFVESRRVPSRGYNPGKAWNICVDRARATPEFAALQKAALDAAVAAYQKGTDYLRAHGGISKIISDAAKAHDADFNLPFGQKGKMSTLIDVQDIRFKAQTRGS